MIDGNKMVREINELTQKAIPGTVGHVLYNGMFSYIKQTMTSGMLDEERIAREINELMQAEEPGTMEHVLYDMLLLYVKEQKAVDAA